MCKKPEDSSANALGLVDSRVRGRIAILFWRAMAQDGPESLASPASHAGSFALYLLPATSSGLSPNRVSHRETLTGTALCRHLGSNHARCCHHAAESPGPPKSRPGKTNDSWYFPFSTGLRQNLGSRICPKQFRVCPDSLHGLLGLYQRKQGRNGLVPSVIFHPVLLWAYGSEAFNIASAA